MSGRVRLPVERGARDEAMPAALVFPNRDRPEMSCNLVDRAKLAFVAFALPRVALAKEIEAALGPRLLLGQRRALSRKLRVPEGPWIAHAASSLRSSGLIVMNA